MNANANKEKDVKYKDMIDTDDEVLINIPIIDKDDEKGSKNE